VEAAREHILPALQARSSAITLVNIEVKDQDARDVRARAQQDICGDCQIVDDAEAGARGWERVVRAAGGAAREAVLERELRRQQRACMRARPARMCSQW
jgi:hypothetical protein